MQDRIARYDLNYSTLRKLDTWTIVSLTAAKFKPLVFPMNGWEFRSQSYFMTGGLPPISSSCPKPLEAHDQRFFVNGTLAVIVWREDGVVSYEYACPFLSGVHFAFALSTSPLSGQALQSRSCLTYVAYATTAAQSQSQNHVATTDQSVSLS
jgi:hypothetical protein